jgi:cell division protein ZapA (FtsZ GTPase activity inhibitor)
MDARVVTVEIGGQRFPIRSTLDQAYVTELAAYVDGKMRAASEAVPAADGIGLAILVALNLADELFRCRDRQSLASDDLNERAIRLEQMLDEVLGSQTRTGLRSSM